MEATKMSELRRALVDRRTEISGEVDRMGSEIRDLAVDSDDEQGGVGNHFADDGSNVSETELLGTISEDLRDILAQIDSALQRMDQGTYGTCQRCGQPIGEERLEAFPYVAFCIDCQTLIERENALRSGY